MCMKTLNIRNIIVPIDFSKMSVQAIQIARQLARRFGASIHLAHVRQSNYTADFVAPAFMTYEQIGEQTALEELKKVASECGVSSATCDVLSGAPPFDEICRLAQTIPCRSRCDADAWTHRVETCFPWQHSGKNCAAFIVSGSRDARESCEIAERFTGQNENDSCPGRLFQLLTGRPSLRDCVRE